MNLLKCWPVFVICNVLISSSASAQWARLAVPGTPRTADGKPNLMAPVPRLADGRPDLTGIWRRNPAKDYFQNLGSGGVEIPFQPWAEELYKQRRAKLSSGRPSERCLPHGIPGAMLIVNFKILVTRNVTAILFEEFNYYRQIHTDGRDFPNATNPGDRTPTWFGYSIGRWEGDTFLVETTGFNDQTWIDGGGLPHTDAMRITERFRRLDFGQMDIEITIDDPKAYTRPWTVNVPFDLMPDTELIENICENEKDAEFLGGR
jgi:hypothetical protein